MSDPQVFRIVHSLDEITEDDILAAYEAGERFVFACGSEEFAVEKVRLAAQKRDAERFDRGDGG